ncbi:MAG: CBS domain-containing protein [Candidatus Tectomicrobia bacterium]|uniref:CBS domain-containing protein n=1 Tax=Tectimicrobiota bacterium TaxID=2528274 RepID=A0A932I182_UNCTE|nr:CBS domain-containing protein [Candidatus Tectomicrobia bacterium]
MSEMSLHEAIHTQRAIRQFTEEPVSEEDVRALLDAAVRAPSGGNRQPWHFVVLRDPELKARVRDLYHRSWNAYKEKVAEMAKTQPEAAATLERWKKHPAGDHFAANLDKVPVLILPCLDMRVLSFGDDPGAPSVMTLNSVYASIYPAVQNLLLTARARGLGAVLTTLHCRYEDEVKRALGIPACVRTACLIPVGHPKARYGETRRVPASDRTHLDGWDASLAASYEPGRGILRVADRMTRNPVTCSPDTLVYDAQAMMREGGFGRLPVVEEGRLVGIISDRDVRGVLLPPDVPKGLKDRFDLLLVRRVKDVMTREPITIGPDASLEQAADLLRANKLGAIPVVEGGWLAGIITRGDVLGGFLDAVGKGRGALRFSLKASRRPGEGGIVPLLKALEDEGAEVLSVVSEPDPADPAGHVHYTVRVARADPRKLIPLLERRGIAGPEILQEEAGKG